MNGPPPLWRDRCLATLLETTHVPSLVAEVVAESDRQVAKFGVQRHTPAEWGLIIAEELGELGKELCRAHFDSAPNPSNLRREAIQVATLALKIAEMASANGGY
jgi:hypothetical protein